MILIIYQTNSYREYVLPGTASGEATILLDRKLFGFKKDIHLKIVSGLSVRQLVSCDEYSVT